MLLPPLASIRGSLSSCHRMPPFTFSLETFQRPIWSLFPIWSLWCGAGWSVLELSCNKWLPTCWEGRRLSYTLPTRSCGREMASWISWAFARDRGASMDACGRWISCVQCIGCFRRRKTAGSILEWWTHGCWSMIDDAVIMLIKNISVIN